MIKTVSQLFIWGFSGTKVSPKLRRLLKKYPPAGVILFHRNIKNPKQLKKLTSDLKKIKRDLLIGTDQEGGRVTRLPLPFTQYPPAAVWGRLYEKGGMGKGGNGEEFFRRIGRLMGRELAANGINLDFAPVLDVNSYPKNPIIGDRAFSKDPKVVVRTAIPFALGLLGAGVLPCGKHWPGHGHTRKDSHKTLPVVSASVSILSKREFFPFRAAIRKKLPLLMTAHVLYRALDPHQPATLSPKILTELLRKKMGFKGLVVTDDLQMKGVARDHTLLTTCLLALSAGCDLLMVCDRFETKWPLIRQLASFVERDKNLKKRVQESLRRQRGLTTKLRS